MTRRIVTPVQYNEKNVKIQTTYNDGNKPITGWTNEKTMFFMENRYVVLKKFVPQEILDMAMDVWKTVENQEEIYDNMFQLERDPINDTPQESLFSSSGAYSTPMGVMLHRWLTKKLESAIDLTLKETYSYTRKYERQAYLRSHTDRPSCEISSTLCLDYKSDDGSPWKIWVKNDDNYVAKEDGSPWDFEEICRRSQDIPIRKRKEDPSIKCLSLEPGDLLLYQGPNVIHWRDTFIGDYTYHIFFHWYNELGKTSQLPDLYKEIGAGMPHGGNHLTYDGRPNPYVSDANRSHEFNSAMNKWNEYVGGDIDAYNNINPRDYINNFSHIKRVEDK